MRSFAFSRSRRNFSVCSGLVSLYSADTAVRIWWALRFPFMKFSNSIAFLPNCGSFS